MPTVEGTAAIAGEGNIGRPNEDPSVECLARLKLDVVFTHHLYGVSCSGAGDLWEKSMFDEDSLHWVSGATAMPSAGWENDL